MDGTRSIAGTRRSDSVGGRSVSRNKRGPGSIARSGLSVATCGASPFSANLADQLDRTEANILMSAVMTTSNTTVNTRLKRLAEARIISAALADGEDLVGLRMQRRELEDEEKRLRAMLDVERTRVRHSRAIAGSASILLQYPSTTVISAAEPHYSLVSQKSAQAIAASATHSSAGNDRHGFDSGYNRAKGESTSSAVINDYLTTEAGYSASRGLAASSQGVGTGSREGSGTVGAESRREQTTHHWWHASEQ